MEFLRVYEEWFTGVEVMHSRSLKKNTFSKMIIATVVIAIVGVLAVRCFSLSLKNSEYSKREAELEAQILEEEAKARELEAYEAYMKTQQYVEDEARSKLGLVYDDQIIFKEQ